MSTVLIVNPASAGGATRKRWPELESTIRRGLAGDGGGGAGGGEIEVRFTERPGHGTTLAREAIAAGATLVVAMGGDGTLNEVVNGFFPDPTTPAAATAGAAPVAGASAAALGVLPAGTGGDFLRTSGTSREVALAARALARATPRRIDVGRLSFVDHAGQPAVRHFVNIASFGIGGLVDQLVNSSTKALGGKVSFYLATLRATLRYRNARCRITLDDAPPVERGIYSVAVANGRYFGGGMMIAPDAALDDGQFDVVTLGDVGKATVMLHGSKIYRGAHLGLDFVSVARAKQVVAEPLDADAPPVLLDVDGEAPGRLPATFTLLPSAITARF